MPRVLGKTRAGLSSVVGAVGDEEGPTRPERSLSSLDGLDLLMDNADGRIVCRGVAC